MRAVQMADGFSVCVTLHQASVLRALLVCNGDGQADR